MALIHHPAVARDIARAALWYRGIDPELEQAFLAELKAAFARVEASPQSFHFDHCGWRRLNLKRFPYHVLFEEAPEMIRVLVIRHHHQNPRFGVTRQ